MAFLLIDEAEKEAMEYFDKNIRILPKKKNGSVDPYKANMHNNDADAFRHAYVSGRFTQKYGETIARLLGEIYEEVTRNPPEEKNTSEGVLSSDIKCADLVACGEWSTSM